MFFRKRRPESREKLSATADTAIVAATGMFALFSVMNVGINVSGMIFPRVFDPVSAIGRTVSQGAVLAEIGVLHSMIGAALLAVTAVGLLAMVVMILAWGFRDRGLASISCSCAVLVAMATPLPRYVVAKYLSAGWHPWSSLPGADEALWDAVMSPDAGSPDMIGFNPAFLVAVVLLSLYRFALARPSMPGSRILPRSLRPEG